MVRALFVALFGKHHVAFHSTLPLEVTVLQLKQSIQHGPRLSVAGMRGTVSAQRIRLCWKRPFVSNSFKPYFIGQCIPTERGARLEGAFQMHPFIRTVMIGMFVSLLIFPLVAVVRHWQLTHELAPALFASLAVVPAAYFMAGAVLVIVKISRWAARDDETMIAAEIHRALQSGQNAQD
ncbi:hypothetical protein CEE60_03370 [Stenotrophomonas maltophilia]|jgi:hypothetical protein|uniref:Transmembrane protein n=1 Tax=Stenotrophomonas maltophilia TaxID=40324 RepID=A0A246HS16_STEMA|nr:hypothetical protein [Stenotrophomonas maltophilia]OWQ56180.1 hypothetical protein CEE60_03370 [Stenotrophomonas maltophilia]